MSDDGDNTVKIRLNKSLGEDSQGRSVWTKPVEPVELELVSTQMLEQLLESGDEEQTARIRELADTEGGVLTRDPTSKELGMVSEAEVTAALRSSGEGAGAGRAGDKSQKAQAQKSGESAAADQDSEWELVTTQMLRQMLSGDDIIDRPEPDEPDSPQEDAGYNPYDRRG